MVKWSWSKKHNGSDLVLTMLIWGVASVLITRLILKIGNNPEITFGVWHIAHVLWGGIFMLAALLMLLTQNGAKAIKGGAVLGGIGWGLFIDEIGKYLTRDNDYWFQPAIIFIYISFVVIFLVYRLLERSGSEDTKTVLYSVLDQMGEIMEEDLEEREKKAIITNLDLVLKSDGDGETKKLAKALRIAVSGMTTIKDRDYWGLKKIITSTIHMSYRLFQKKAVWAAAAGYSVYFAVDKIVDTFRIVSSDNRLALIEYFYSGYDFFGKADIYMIGFKIGFDFVCAWLIVAGWYFWMKKKTLLSIQLFRNGLMVNILISSVFRFYFEQFSAVFALVSSVILLEVLGLYRRQLRPEWK